MSRIAITSFRLLAAFLGAAACFAFFSTQASAQRRDYMTDPEVEIIRDAQDIDTRVDVITKMIDRRFAVLGIDVGGWKDAAKVSDTWGVLPKDTRVELLSDIKKLLQKAVDDIDNLAANPKSAPIREKGDERAKRDPGRLNNAVRGLGAAAARYLAPLRAELDNSANDVDKGPILDSIDLCGQIIEAVGNLPPEHSKKNKQSN